MADDRWENLLEVVSTLASERDLPRLLSWIVRQACELIGARYGALGVLATDPADPHRLAEFITHGLDESTRAAIDHPPHGEGVLGQLIDHPVPLRTDDLRHHHRAVGVPAHHPEMTTFLGVPILVSGTVFGNLYLTEKLGGFTADDEAVAVALASAAGVAIANARLYAALTDAQVEQARLAVFEDRDRIARDLHDHVIQRLYATGLQLDRVARRSAEPEVAERVSAAIDQIDDTIAQIRRTIFALGQTEDPASVVLQVVEDAAVTLGFSPTLSAHGAVDELPEDLLGDVVAVVREGLSNAARHARARAVEVDIEVNQRITVMISDDGVGLPSAWSGSGLQNLRERALARGGTFVVGRSLEGGVQLEWRIPNMKES